jgi:hypothetical protein
MMMLLQGWTMESGGGRDTSVVVVAHDAPEGEVAHAVHDHEGGEPRLGGPVSASSPRAARTMESYASVDPASASSSRARRWRVCQGGVAGQRARGPRPARGCGGGGRDSRGMRPRRPHLKVVAEDGAQPRPDSERRRGTG